MGGGGQGGFLVHRVKAHPSSSPPQQLAVGQGPLPKAIALETSSRTHCLGPFSPPAGSPSQKSKSDHPSYSLTSLFALLNPNLGPLYLVPKRQRAVQAPQPTGLDTLGGKPVYSDTELSASSAIDSSSCSFS